MEQLRMIHRMKNLPEFTLAEGFSLRLYQEGDIPAWTEICSYGLLEGDLSEGWKTCMEVFDTLIPERDVYFICDKNGKAVATCTAFATSENVSLLHMLGALPEARGNRLATSMTVYGIRKMAAEMGEKESIMRLKSDDWRVSAVRTYLQCGFQPVLFDEGMQERWQAICDKVDLHGIEMLDDNGNPTGIIL